VNAWMEEEAPPPTSHHHHFRHQSLLSWTFVGKPFLQASCRVRHIDWLCLPIGKRWWWCIGGGFGENINILSSNLIQCEWHLELLLCAYHEICACFHKMCMFHKKKCMHLDEKEDLNLVNSCSILLSSSCWWMDGRILASISMATNGESSTTLFKGGGHHHPQKTLELGGRINSLGLVAKHWGWTWFFFFFFGCIRAEVNSSIIWMIFGFHLIWSLNMEDLAADQWTIHMMPFSWIGLLVGEQGLVTGQNLKQMNCFPTIRHRSPFTSQQAMIWK